MLVQYEQPNPHIALIRLNRPDKMNAFSTTLERDLLTALQRACADEEVRVVVFAGSGRAFSGGWDLAESGFAMTSGTAKLLPVLVGLANARKLALLGQTIDGREAYRIGLVVELAAEGEHEAAALRLAEEALKGAPLALAAQKQLLDAGLAMPLEALQDFEVQVSFRLTHTEDHQEAKRAFAAKRRPSFKGR